MSDLAIALLCSIVGGAIGSLGYSLVRALMRRGSTCSVCGARR